MEYKYTKHKDGHYTVEEIPEETKPDLFERSLEMHLAREQAQRESNDHA